MPNTPNQRNTRANSNATNINLNDIKALIEKSKDEILSAVKRENDKLYDLVESLNQKLLALEKKNLDLEAKCERLKDQSVNSVDFVINEYDQRKKRENNVIVFGLAEKTLGPLDDRNKHDEDHVKSLAETLQINSVEISETRRLGSSVGKRPLLVRLKDTQTKFQMLRESRLLNKCPQYQRVYIKPDLTRLQQSQRKELLSELRTRRERGEEVFLRGNRIVSKDSSRDFQ